MFKVFEQRTGVQRVHRTSGEGCKQHQRGGEGQPHCCGEDGGVCRVEKDKTLLGQSVGVVEKRSIKSVFYNLT